MAWAVAGLALIWARPAAAQDAELRLSLSKDWGFAAGGQIQGSFTLSARGPQDMTSVRFELDGQEIASVTQPPFTLRFSTDKYPTGRHTFSATGYVTGGRSLQSNTIQVEFVSAEQGWQVTQRIMIPLLAMVGVIILVTAIGPLVLSGKSGRRLEPGAPRHYGAAAGGAICPKCGQPFALSVWSLNLVTRKLERCPYCGKWSLVARASHQALAAAEAAQRQASQPTVPEANPEDKRLRQIEDSRYQ